MSGKQLLYSCGYIQVLADYGGIIALRIICNIDLATPAEQLYLILSNNTLTIISTRNELASLAHSFYTCLKH